MNYVQILNNFRNKSILVVGDIILDHYVEGRVDRISPEAPVPVVTVYRDDRYNLGGAGNVANNIVSLGARAYICGTTGNDDRGSILNNILGSKGIITDGILPTSRRTTVKTRVIAHNHQQVVRVDREDNTPLSLRETESIRNYLRKNFHMFDGVIISDYSKGVITRELISYTNRLAKKHRKTVAVDPKVGHFEYYKNVSFITPNKKEASVMSNIDINDDLSLSRAGKRLLSSLNCKGVLITRGEEGMSLFERGKKEQKIRTVARDVYDVTGAGDTVISVFTLAHVAGATLFQAAKLANHAAGIVVAEAGTATTTMEEIKASLRSSK
ncbi:MAG: D-glycero-beta-D-manno-heptose-7-phosphate kinase [Nitrospirota bacterium]|nr:MAG: D-glycero-beta-D-manno-heptose-7-phosphate kinase [Nitrospirota bacterium]